MQPGTRLGAYEIIAKLGEGGMGQVYRARDTHLDRDVAIKILPDTLAGDPERAGRFEREAKTLAALNHPNIAQIHGFETYVRRGGASSSAEASAKAEAPLSALVMELVEGEDLAQRIARGPIALDEALPIARQIAEALEAAHEQGIIHRDLKPANIKVRPNGTVKVLDFGLAKALDPNAANATTLNSPTLTSPVTAHGIILGTAAYMSPEQARGRAVDRRSDIWSFGLVLYEMLTGQRAFAGTDVSETLAAVLRDSPALDKIPAATPAAVRVLLRRCLDRDPQTRLRDIGEARIVLSGAPAAADVAPATPTSAWRVWLALAAGLALGAAAMTVLPFQPTRDTAAAVRKLPITVQGLELTQDKTPVISPDGRRIVYSANGSLWVRDLSRLEPQQLTGTADAAGMFWSPDSTRVGFIRSGHLWTVAIGSGQATSVATLPGNPCGEPGGLWQASGRILLTLSCNTYPLFAVSDLGGDLSTAFTVEKPEERDVHQMAALPGNRTIILALDRASSGIDTLIAWNGTTRKTILQVPNDRLASPAYSPTGHLLYQRTANNPGVWAVPFSVDRLEATGEPFLVASGMGAPSVALNGTLLMVPLASTGTNQLAWVTDNGEITSRLDETHPRIEEPRLSPDGRRVAFSLTAPEGGRNIWVRNVSDPSRTRITSGPTLRWRPFWSADGQHVYYAEEQPGRSGQKIARQSSGGGGVAETIVELGTSGSVSRDGRWLVYTESFREAGRRLMKRRLDVDDAPSPVIEMPGTPLYADISPDQKLVAFSMDGPGDDDGIYVTRFPDGQGQWQLDAARGNRPRWSRTGDRLYFTRYNEIWQIDVKLTAPPQFGRATRVFSGAERRVWPSIYGFDVDADGRFLVVASAMQDVPPVMTVVDNWFVEFANRR